MGKFSNGCTECGGGALKRPCPLCQGDAARPGAVPSVIPMMQELDTGLGGARCLRKPSQSRYLFTGLGSLPADGCGKAQYYIATHAVFRRYLSPAFRRRRAP
jgi:hypothetical protein